MRMVLLCLLLVATGCRTTAGPREVHQRDPYPDNPNLSLDEQAARSRARFSLPIESRQLVPYGGISTYGSTNPQFN